MTNPTLERAARAAAIACEQVRPSDEHDAEAWTFIARAVLMAVRELDDDVRQRGSVIYCEGRSGLFTAMIDAILNDGEGE